MSKAPVGLTLFELTDLLTVTRQHDNRAYVLFLVAVSHGLRVSEVINLRRHDFSVNGSTLYLTVQRLKGSERTTQRLNTSSDPLFDEQTVVAEYLQKLRPNDLLFVPRGGGEMTRWQVTTLIQKFGQMASIPLHKRFPHSLKHTAGILMRKAGANLETIQSALGHKNLNSTAAYLRVDAEEVDEARQQAFATSAGK